MCSSLSELFIRPKVLWKMHVDMQAKLYPEYTIVKMPSSLMQELSTESQHEFEGHPKNQPTLQDSSSLEASSTQSTLEAEATHPNGTSSNEPGGSQKDNTVDCCNLLANAPVHGDHYDYHVDADPLTLPDSTWRRTFGDYCNRY